MDKFDSTEEYLQDAKGIAWDTCHKIYVLMDDAQVEQMRTYNYDPLITSDEQTPSQMLETIKDWYDRSCGLKFVEAVETVDGDPNDGFTSLIPQGYYEECDDCGERNCYGACYDDYEDDDEDEEDED